MNGSENTVPASAQLQEVWEELLAGNARFASGHAKHPRQDVAYRQTLVTGQRPKACVLTCSDSRVPVELLFDVGLGDIFVVRTAGEVIDHGVLASLEYAVSGLGVKVLVVLGHEFCGAVAAAEQMLDSVAMLPGYQRVLIEQITPSLVQARAAGNTESVQYERWHAKATVEKLEQLSRTLAHAVRHEKLLIVPAHFSLTTSQVTEVMIPNAGNIEQK